MKVAIISDVLPILAAGTQNCCGIALIAGTGSTLDAQGLALYGMLVGNAQHAAAALVQETACWCQFNVARRALE